MAKKRTGLAMACAMACLFVWSAAWAGEVHVYANREIQPVVLQLINRRVEVKWAPLERPALMHRKLLIVDSREALLGSCNWTHNAFTRSDEVDVWLDDAEAVNRLAALFNRDWTTGGTQHDEH